MKSSVGCEVDLCNLLETELLSAKSQKTIQEAVACLRENRATAKITEYEVLDRIRGAVVRLPTTTNDFGFKSKVLETIDMESPKKLPKGISVEEMCAIDAAAKLPPIRTVTYRVNVDFNEGRGRSTTVEVVAIDPPESRPAIAVNSAEFVEGKPDIVTILMLRIRVATDDDEIVKRQLRQLDKQAASTEEKEKKT